MFLAAGTGALLCGWKAGLIILVLGMVLLALFYVYTKRCYRDLEALNEIIPQESF